MASEASVKGEESHLELDMSGVIEPDTDSPQEMGFPTVQPTEEEIEESCTISSQAASAFVEKDYEKAIQLYTKAITLNSQAASLYTKRGQIYLLMNKPNACIRDCNYALKLNADSAAAHKFRGRAYHLLGKFEKSAADLRLACKFDFDEQADEWLRQVTPNARKIEAYKAWDSRRKTLEKLASADWEETSGPEGSEEHLDAVKFLNHPIIREALLDPEANDAIYDIYDNPVNILKYQEHPKVMGLLEHLATNFANLTANAESTVSSVPEPNSQNDVDLD